VTTALQMARADNVTLLMHLDPDELLHPGASHSAGMLAGSYSLLPELCNAPSHVPSIRWALAVGFIRQHRMDSQSKAVQR
jgi:hypothetical protein